MTLTLLLLAVLVGVASAIRSTWSPCGVSMLSTITPVTERAKRHRYGCTCAWFIAGAIVGGLALGGVMAGLAVLVAAVGPTPIAAGSAALIATLVVLVSDTGIAGMRLPVHFRQVNERWLDAYRPWVYGTGFGFQIGTGVATYITTATVYLMMVLGALTGRPGFALVLGAGFGFTRGLAVTLTRKVTTPAALVAFHQRFVALRPWADRLVVGSVAVTSVALAVAVGPVPVAVAAVAVGGSVLAARAIVRSAARRPVRAGAAGPAGESPRRTAEGLAVAVAPDAVPGGSTPGTSVAVG
jgi:hypothetical protein